MRSTHLTIRFGGITALNDVSLRAGEWEIVGIIGPNGAGKTTLFNCITGFYSPTAGRVRYRGTDITEMPVHRRTALGIGRTFQNVGLVKNASVAENLATAQHLQVSYDPWAGIAGGPSTFTEERRLSRAQPADPRPARPAPRRAANGSRTCPTAC